MTTQYINSTCPVQFQKHPKKSVHLGPETASKVQLPMVLHEMHLHLGKFDFIQQDFRGKSPLNGTATPRVCAIPAPLFLQV